MPKKILRVTIESVEVPDDYRLKFQNNPGEPFIISEFDGHFHAGGQSGENKFYFVSSDPDLNAISPVMQFIWWSSMAWQGFSLKLPTKLKTWLSNFVESKRPAAVYAHSVHENMSRRRDEINTGMVQFKEWDDSLFEKPEKLWSIN